MPNQTTTRRSLLLTPLLLASILGVASGSESVPDVITLERDQSQRVVIGIGTVIFEEELPSVRIEVPASAFAIRVWTTDATGDVTLTGSFDGTPPRGYEIGGGQVEGANTWPDESLLITRADSQPLRAGSWTFSIGSGDQPVDIKKFVPISCNVHFEILEPSRASLSPGKPIEITLTRDHGMRAVLTLPEGFQADRNSLWRVEAYSPDHDIDLIAGPKNPVAALDFPYATSIREIGYERVEIRGRQMKNISFQIYALPELEVLDQIPVTLRLLEVTDLGDTSAPLPSFLPPVSPPIANPNSMSVFEQAACSTVAIYGPFGAGSGTILSSDGLILTNAHVVSGSHLGSGKTPALGQDGEQWAADYKGRNRWLPRLHGGFNSDPRLPASPSFGLEIVDYRQELDLALLRIVSTLDGQPLPKGLVFPNITLGSSADIKLGSPLISLGYPMTGGSSALVSITLTRGICAGFAVEPEGPIIKTDAGTHSGVSGGTLLNEAGHMVGIPSASITDANFAGGIGFAIPVESIPSEWLRRAGASIPGKELPQATFEVACGCSIDGVGSCGNYIALEGKFHKITNSKELGLGVMEWCKRMDVKVFADGKLVDGNFQADFIEEIR